MGDDWNSFMQSKSVRIALNSFCSAICFFYSVAAVRELLHPEAQPQYVEAVGLTGYYAITGIRLVVMVWVAIVFARMAIKTFKDK